MQEEKHQAALKEIDSYIEECLSKRLLDRQRLLMAALSIGMQHIIELWLHKAHAIKPGATVKHEFFKSGERKLKVKLSGMLTRNISDLKNSDIVLAMAREIERNRDDIIYGAPLPNDKSLREKVDYFFELKKAIKESVGAI